MTRDEVLIDVGTWGSGSFENDAAMDWVDGFVDEPSVSRLRAALDDVSGLNDEEAIAAAELVAAMKGRPAPDLNELQEVVSALQPLDLQSVPDLTMSALVALNRIEAQAGNLKDSWQESGDPEVVADWHMKISELKARLEL